MSVGGGDLPRAGAEESPVVSESVSQVVRCRHGNDVAERPACGCMLIDGILHPCYGCPPTCGNCL